MRLQLRRLGLFPQLLRFHFRLHRIVARLEQRSEVSQSGAAEVAGRGKGLEEGQGDSLRHAVKPTQRRWIIRFETGNQLVGEACLRLDQGVLVAGESLELLNEWRIGLQAAQLPPVATANTRQDPGVNGVRLRPRWLAALLDELGVDRIDGQALLQ